MASAAVLNLDFRAYLGQHCVKFGLRTDISDTTVTIADYPTFGKIQNGGGCHLEFGTWPYLGYR